MTKHFLDLRDKSREKIRVIERVVFQPRSFKYEMARMFIVIFTVALIGFGISNADDIPVIKEIVTPKEEVKPIPFSAVGIISEINEQNLKISPAKSSDRTEDSFVISLSKLKNIETNTFDNLTITDLEVGDKIVVQGATLDNEIFARKIINFSPRFPDTVTEGKYPYIEPALFVSEMATTTEDVATTTIDTASTTEEVSTSTEETGTITDTSSESNDPNILEQVVDTITETVKDVVDTVVETITDITTPEETSTPEENNSSENTNESNNTESSGESNSNESSSSDNSSSDSSSGDSTPSSE